MATGTPLPLVCTLAFTFSQHWLHALSLSRGQVSRSSWRCRPVMSKEKKRSRDLKTSLLNHGRGMVSGGSVCFQWMKRTTVSSLDSCVKSHAGLRFSGYTVITSGCLSDWQWSLSHWCGFFSTALSSARCQSPVNKYLGAFESKDSFSWNIESYLFKVQSVYYVILKVKKLSGSVALESWKHNLRRGYFQSGQSGIWCVWKQALLLP